MQKRNTMKASRPKPLLSRVKINTRQLLLGLSKVAVNVAAKRWPEAIAELPGTISAIGLSNKASEAAWLLIERALGRAVASLLKEFYEDSIAQDLSSTLPPLEVAEESSIDLDLDEEFFSRPHGQTFALNFLPVVERWLVGMGFADHNARNISTRLPAYLAPALDEEWRSNPALYGSILEAAASPFTNAASLEAQWLRYRAALAREIDKPVFQESFSLRQIYVSPRTYFQRSHALQAERSFNVAGLSDTSKDEPARVVVDARDELIAWVRSKDKEFALRVLSGGPGMGKSSFCKMFAHHVANVLHENVVLIPLDRLDMRSDFTSAVSSYLADTDLLRADFVDLCDPQRPLLLILDGLDELEMQGKVGLEIAQNFVREVIRSVDRINNTHCRLRVLVSGRDISIQDVQSDLRKPGQILWLLPYFVQKSEKYVDERGLLKADQRDVWWRTFGNLKSLPYDKMPSALKRGEIGDVTSQPLLNYLVALSFQSPEFSVNGPGSINLLYSHLVRAVHSRAWASDPHPTVREITLDAFFRLLEEVALAVWHGDGRKTTIKAVEAHCRRSNIAALLPGFEKGAEAGIASLFLAFYFRQHGRSEGERTFEFTHKSFGEYLVAKRIVRAIEQIEQKIREASRDIDAGWSYEEALHRWLSLAGQTALDGYLLPFIRQEIELRSPETAAVWRETLTAVFSEFLAKGWPMERQKELGFRDQQRWARNAEETLVAVLNCCSKHSKQPAAIKWPTNTAFGEMIKRLQGQRPGPMNRVIMTCLSYIEAPESCLDVADLYNADLSHSNLSKCTFNYTMMLRANLSNSDLEGAVFFDANLEGAKLHGTNLKKVSFRDTRVSVGQLLEAGSLQGAHWRDGDMVHAPIWYHPDEKQRSELAEKGMRFVPDERQIRRRRRATRSVSAPPSQQTDADVS